VAESCPNVVGNASGVRVAVRAWSVKVAPLGPLSAGPDGPLLTAPTRPAKSSTRSAHGRTIRDMTTHTIDKKRTSRSVTSERASDSRERT
jgi:hypothetical protein